MKIFARLLVLGFIATWSMSASAQSYYWVMLTDKQGSQFDPYAYFDEKAVERYQQYGADLYDITNYPLNGEYVSTIEGMADDLFGQSRWLNAVAVEATTTQIESIRQLPFVYHVVKLEGDMLMATHEAVQAESVPPLPNTLLTDQLIRMQGDAFRKKGVDGTGMRVAVLDGGFPKVNAHPAFQHLYDNKRVLDTWNFCNKKENVYMGSTHGTMTLSCITGIYKGQQLGLATGAEFLLYRTEINTEPFKEEVWWMQAMERADQKGANIISSSLGYGKERYCSKDMDGTSYVAKAANMAARKGILVCNSAGNEADDKQWKIVITPADADSVLGVGGISPSLTEYRHIDFSSYGPTADGRMKPNVCAFGHAVVANPKGGTTEVDGTSFSCPLVAGFAACAWQLNRDKTAMEMKTEIERSADLYPYFDYALGYGVPQAEYFTEPKTGSKTPIVEFEEIEKAVLVRLKEQVDSEELFFNLQDPKGILSEYSATRVSGNAGDTVLLLPKSSLANHTLNVSIKGCALSYKLADAECQKFAADGKTEEPKFYKGLHMSIENHRTLADNNPRKWGSNSLWRGDIYLLWGDAVQSNKNEAEIGGWSPAVRFGGRLMCAPAKCYALGLGLEIGRSSYHFSAADTLAMDNNIAQSLNPSATIAKKRLRHGELSLEFFQRVRFVAGGLLSKGLNWDLGIYGSYGYSRYNVYLDEASAAYGSANLTFRNVASMDPYRWNWGLTTRLSFDFIGIYARYRMSRFDQSEAPQNERFPDASGLKNIELPRLEIGLELMF